MKKKLISELDRVGYFQYNTKEDKEKFVEAIKDYSTGFKGILKIINRFTFQFDHRSFLVDEHIDDNDLKIDRIGRVDKQAEFSMRFPLDHREFTDFMQTLGLIVSLPKEIIIDEVHDLATYKFSINSKSYTIQYPYLDDNKLISGFAEAMNDALNSIASVERCYLIGRFPTILLFVTGEIYAYLKTMTEVKGYHIQSPAEWLAEHTKTGKS